MKYIVIAYEASCPALSARIVTGFPGNDRRKRRQALYFTTMTDALLCVEEKYRQFKIIPKDDLLNFLFDCSEYAIANNLQTRGNYILVSIINGDITTMATMQQTPIKPQTDGAGDMQKFATASDAIVTRDRYLQFNEDMEIYIVPLKVFEHLLFSATKE